MITNSLINREIINVIEDGGVEESKGEIEMVALERGPAVVEPVARYVNKSAQSRIEVAPLSTCDGCILCNNLCHVEAWLKDARVIRKIAVLRRFVACCIIRYKLLQGTMAKASKLSRARGGMFMPIATRRWSNADGVHESKVDGGGNVLVLQVGTYRYQYTKFHGEQSGIKVVEYSVGNGPRDVMKDVLIQIPLPRPAKRHLNRALLSRTAREFLELRAHPEGALDGCPGVPGKARARFLTVLYGLANRKRLSVACEAMLDDFRQFKASVDVSLKHTADVIADAHAGVSGRLDRFVGQPESLVSRWRKLKAFIVYKPAKHNQPSLHVITKREKLIDDYNKVGLPFKLAPLVGNYTIVTPRLFFRCLGMCPVEFLSVEFQANFEARLESFDENHIAIIDGAVLTGLSLRPYEEREAAKSSTFVTDFVAEPATPAEGWEEEAVNIRRRVVVKKHKRHHRINYSSHEAVAAARIKFPYVDGLVAELVGPRNLAIRHFISEKLIELGWRVTDISSHLDEFVLIVNLPSAQTIEVRDLTNSSVAALRRAGATGVGGSVSV